MTRFFQWLDNLNSQRSRKIGLWLAVFFFLLPIPSFEFTIGADTYEYLAMTNAFRNHYSPDIRIEDEPVGGVRPSVGLHESSRTGATYAWHFWLYSLCAAPLVSLPYPWGGEVANAFTTLNRLFFVLAVWSAVFAFGLSRRQRLLWLTLSTLSVVVMYLRWVGPELFCWSLVTLSLSFLSGRRYVGACVCAALAAMQNPPLLFLAFGCAGLSLSTRSPRVILLSLIAAATSFLPMAFYQIHFGVISLIARHGHASWRFFSLERLFSFFFDLNFGMFFYTPVLVILWMGALWRMRRQKQIVILNMTVIAMLLTSLLTAQWCAANMGVFRYAVWMIPVFAYVACTAYREGRALPNIVLIALWTQLLLVNDLPGWLRWRGMARFTLQHAPRLYSPNPEIFTDYSLERDTIGEEWKQFLPVAFFDEQGNATKVLVTTQTLRTLPQFFLVENFYFKEVLQGNNERTGWYYLHPPAGALKRLK